MHTVIAPGHPREPGKAQGGAAAVQEMLARGLTIGVGQSSNPGWFEVVGFDRDKKTADSSRFVRSCSSDERLYIFRQTLNQIQCRARENFEDVIHTVIEIISPSELLSR